MNIKADIQKLDPGQIVDLFTIDATAQGGRLLRFVPAAAGAPPARAVYSFGGNPYYPHPIEMTGVRSAADGPSARPTLKVSAVNPLATFLILGTDNLRGATVTRTRTFARHLDGAAAADATRTFGVEVWRVETLTARDKRELTWQLASPLDFDDKRLPGRQVLRDLCNWRYRRWDPVANAGAGGWDYTAAECPYTGANFFDDQDIPTTHASADRCSRRLSGCRARFPRAAGRHAPPLPFGGFPGVGLARS